MEQIDKRRSFVFQVDSDVVKNAYETLDNYLIEYTKGDDNVCAVYFSSNNIYFPNNKKIFTRRITEKNFFEWYATRIKRASKHIFVRDIFKQWYLGGINSTINTAEKIKSFLLKETNGYDVITVGSSAGGYAAILFGSLINAKLAITFNPQFEIASLLHRSSEDINPLIFRLNGTKKRYFDIVPLINQNTEIFYLYSSSSPWDREQNLYAPHLPNIHRISFNTFHHGIPFQKAALIHVLNYSREELIKLEGKNHHPILFTIKIVGLFKTLQGILIQLYHYYQKRR